jgi:hypothetical protein
MPLAVVAARGIFLLAQRRMASHRYVMDVFLLQQSSSNFLHKPGRFVMFVAKLHFLIGIPSTLISESTSLFERGSRLCFRT